MRRRDDEYPIQLRDEAFELFRSCLGAAEAEARFKQGVEALARRSSGSWVKAAYLDDKTPRYLLALKQAAAVGEADGPFSREVRIGRILFNAGLFFDAHEYLEAFWKLATGQEKRSLQGLIQAGAGMHKLEQGSASGCAHLLREAAAKLATATGPSLRAFGDALLQAAKKADRGELTPEQAPQLADGGLEL